MNWRKVFSYDWPYYILDLQGHLRDETGKICFPDMVFSNPEEAEQFLIDNNERGNVRSATKFVQEPVGHFFNPEDESVVQFYQRNNSLTRQEAIHLARGKFNIDSLRASGAYREYLYRKSSNYQGDVISNKKTAFCWYDRYFVRHDSGENYQLDDPSVKIKVYNFPTRGLKERFLSEVGGASTGETSAILSIRGKHTATKR